MQLQSILLVEIVVVPVVDVAVLEEVSVAVFLDSFFCFWTFFWATFFCCFFLASVFFLICLAF